MFRNLQRLDAQEADAVLILSGDHVYRADYRRFVATHLERGADVSVLMGDVPAAEASAFGVLETRDSRVVRFLEKPADPRPWARAGRCSINLGVYCFRPRFLCERLAVDARCEGSAHDFGRDVLPASLRAGAVESCPLATVSPQPYWRDVGTIDALFEASMDVVRGEFEFSDPRTPAAAPAARRWRTNLVADDVETHGASLCRCVLSPGVRIEPGCELEECVLFPGARVGRGSRLSRVIVEEGVWVPPGTRTAGAATSGEVRTTPRGVAVFAGDYAGAQEARSATRLHRRSG